MPRFFIKKEAVSEQENGSKYISITGSDACHIVRSLRMTAGEELVVCDMQKKEYVGRILSVSAECVIAEVLSEQTAQTEPPYQACLYQAVAKGDKMDTIIQKAVETGVYEIVPVHTERCIAKIPKDAAEKKQARWQKIAQEAAKQCGRSVIPQVRPVLSFDQAVAEASSCAIPLFCYEGDHTRQLKEILRDESLYSQVKQPEAGLSIALMIGPEGGFGTDEVQKAQQAGMLLTGLGKRILRTETAAAFVLACLVYEFETDS